MRTARAPVALARKDVPTCGLDERLSACATSFASQGWEAGGCRQRGTGRLPALLRAKSWLATGFSLISQAMRAGRALFRPYVPGQRRWAHSMRRPQTRARRFHDIV